jgi:hypothetical protein
MPMFRSSSAALHDGLEHPQQPQIHVAELAEQRTAFGFFYLHGLESKD